MANPHFNARVIPLASQVRLARVETGDQRVAEAVGIPQGITDCRHSAVGPRPFLSLRQTQHGVASIEVRAQAAERSREDAGDLRIDSS